jgi:hypothetical protein
MVRADVQGGDRHLYFIHQLLSFQRHDFSCKVIHVGEATSYDRVNLADLWLSFP